jgi:hypothetical protein
MAVTAQRGAQSAGLRWGCLGEQCGQVGRPLAVRRLRDDLGGDLADPGQGLQRAVADPAFQLAGREFLDHLGGPAKCPHPVGRRASRSS